MRAAVRFGALALLLSAIVVLVLVFVTACGPDNFTVKCNNDGGVEHTQNDAEGHPVKRICTKGGRVIHSVPLPTPVHQWLKVAR
jgi:hypothetical protein